MSASKKSLDSYRSHRNKNEHRHDNEDREPHDRNFRFTTVQLSDTVTTLDAINNHGESAGSYAQEDFRTSVAFVYDNGIVTDIDSNMDVPVGVLIGDINNKGDVVGTLNLQFGPYNAFVYANGISTNIQFPVVYPSYGGTSATGINETGKVVGTYLDEIGRHGFIYDQGAYTNLEAPGAIGGTFANGINDRGQIVGGFDDSQGVRGFIYDKGTYVILDMPDASFTEALEINNEGEVLGRFNDCASRVHGFIWDDGDYTVLRVPGAAETTVTGMNDNGQVVGYFGDSNANVHSFFYDDGTYTTFDVPGAAHTEAKGINDRGDVVGSYIDIAGMTQGFLATGMDGSSKDMCMRDLLERETKNMDMRDLVPGAAQGWATQADHWSTPRASSFAYTGPADITPSLMLNAQG